MTRPRDSSTPDDPTALDVQLDHASIMTTDLDEAISFYVDLIGLSPRTVEDDPVRDGRKRAMLTDEVDVERDGLVEVGRHH